MMRQLAATIDERMPEPWGPVVDTSKPRSVNRRTPRLNSRRPSRFRIGSSAVAVTHSGSSRARPPSFQRVGRTKRWKQSTDATGLPGSPKK